MSYRLCLQRDNTQHSQIFPFYSPALQDFTADKNEKKSSVAALNLSVHELLQSPNSVKPSHGAISPS
jgi:hypothetical protein